MGSPAERFGKKSLRTSLKGSLSNLYKTPKYSLVMYEPLTNRKEILKGILKESLKNSLGNIQRHRNSSQNIEKIEKIEFS